MMDIHWLWLIGMWDDLNTFNRYSRRIKFLSKIYKGQKRMRFSGLLSADEPSADESLLCLDAENDYGSSS